MICIYHNTNTILALKANNIYSNLENDFEDELDTCEKKCEGN